MCEITSSDMTSKLMEKLCHGVTFSLFTIWISAIRFDWHQNLDPGPLLATKEKLATQVFSHQVVAALSMCATDKLLLANVLPTEEFVESMDTLFDIMNSRKLYADKLARCALSHNSENMARLSQLKIWILGWKFRDVKSQSRISCH